MENQEMDFATWFKELRIKHGFSKRKMAIALGVSGMTVFNLETKKTRLTPQILLKISTRFNIPQEEIRSLKGVDL